ncbi:MAG: HAMP domain-containing histidine kinase [Oscillospiraceae bacterium]|jgi:signal transduction histidine kinase|nr:HAMP domain-containing histidine kinase [Oscillospiraceae bacterium]
MMNQRDLNAAFSETLSSLDIRLRGKLSVLLPALDLLEKRIASGGEDAALLRYLGEARRAAFSILRLARNLGDQAKYAVDYDMSDPVRTDLAELFAGIVAETRKLAVYKRTPVTLDCAEEPFYAFLDPGMVSRLLYNLLSNAVLHGEGGVGVELSREDGSILFKVRNGGGEMPFIYEGRDGRETPCGAGNILGTGLSVASAIVCQCGGTMMATSDKPNGTVVTVSLPDLPGVDEGELGIPGDPCEFPRHLVELSDFPAYHTEYNLKRKTEPSPDWENAYRATERGRGEA